MARHTDSAASKQSTRNRQLLARCMLCLAATLLITQPPRWAMAQDQMQGKIVITDIGDFPITAELSGGTNQMTQTVSADPASPHTISATLAIDGIVTAGTGVGVLFDDGNIVSDIMQVTLTPKKRGGQNGMISYFDASITFMSAPDSNGLDLSTLGLADDINKKILAAGLPENGTYQSMGSSTILDSTTGNPFSMGGLTLLVASDTPEPSGLVLLGSGGALLALALRRRRR